MLCVGGRESVVCAEAVVRCSAGGGAVMTMRPNGIRGSSRGEEGAMQCEKRAMRRANTCAQLVLPSCDKLFAVGMWSCGCGVAFHTPDVSCLFLAQGSAQGLRQKVAQWLHSNVNGKREQLQQCHNEGT